MVPPYSESVAFGQAALCIAKAERLFQITIAPES